MFKILLFFCASFPLLFLPTVAPAWDPVKDTTGKRLDQHFKSAGDEIKRIPRNVEKCVGNLGKCAERTIRQVPYMHVWPVVERYKNHLFNQGNGRWQSLPAWLVPAVQPHYPQIDVAQVRFATNVDTIHGQAITWEHSIFYPRDINLRSRDDLRWMLHELEHVVQYRQKGGYKEFISEYLLHGAGKIVQCVCVDVHDNIGTERAADQKANAILDQVWRQIQMPPPAASLNQPPRGAFPAHLPQMPIAPPAFQCATAFGRCALFRPQPQGTQCFCSTGFRQDWGFAQ